jgi:hypothetical protein
LTTFDAPGGVQSCTRRLRSDTPLQALTLLNDRAFVEIAQGLAARILRECPEPATDQQRLEHAIGICLGRPPLEPELKTLEAVLAQERAESPQSRPRGGHAPPPDWVTIARILLNLDEFVTRE